MWEILVIILCLILNGILAATELAFVSMNKGRLRHLAETGDKSAERAMLLRENPERTLAVLQLGITFVGVIAAAVGGAESGGKITPYLMRTFQWSHGFSQAIAILIFVIPYTYINVLFSELLPKALAFYNPRKVLFFSIRWLIVLGKILWPFVYLLEKSTKWSLRLFFPFTKKEEPERTEEPFSVGRFLRPYMVNLAKLERKTVKDVMIPWQETDKASKAVPIEEVVRIALETRHTRLPILEKETPVGILHTKELFDFDHSDKKEWQTLLHPLIKIDEQETLITALRQMQEKRSHMSVIMRGEEPLGIVTIEDIFEEVVGEIYDEDDPRVEIK